MKSQKIIHKLLIWFLLIALVPLTSITTITYFMANYSQKKEVKNNLVSIADSKAKQLENYIQERQKNASAIAEIPTIVDAIENYKKVFNNFGTSSPEYQNIDKKYRFFLNNYIEIFDYSNIYLISQSGELLFSARDRKKAVNYYSTTYKNSEIAKVFDRAKTLMQVEVSNFGSLDQATNQPAAYIAAPVFNKDLIIGVVVLQLNYQNFNKVVNDYTGLGKTGETVVGSAVGSQIIFISPTRHDPSAAFRRTVKVDRKKVHPLDKASHGQQGIGITIDYKGKETIAAWRYLPSLNGGILVKINTFEAFSSLKELRKVVIILVFITLSVVIIAAFVVAKSISKPVVQLTEVVQEFARGNLHQQAPVLTHDEIGQLAESFNSMGKQLKESLAENMRLGAELNVARMLQQMILPKPEELENIEGLDIVAFMESADEVGGDYYDVLETDGIVTLGIGDVTGHGLESGILMLMAQTAVRTLQEIREVDPVRFLDTLNRTIYKNVQRMESDKSLTLAIINYAEGKISISGQHEETIIVRKGGHIERIDTMDLGFPIGLDAEIADFISHAIFELHPGDGIVLYTDGIPEAKDINKVQYQVERLCEVLSENWHKSASEIKDDIIADLRQHIGKQKVFDDITLLVLKRQAEQTEEVQQELQTTLTV